VSEVKERYRRGQRVYRQGQGAEFMYRVETGLVRLSQHGARGRTFTLRHVLPGDYFGEAALQGSGAAHGHLAETLTNTVVTVLAVAELSDAQLLSVAQNLAGQLHRAMTFRVHLQSGDLRERVVRYLLELVDTPLGAEDAENRLFVRATHELVAEGTGGTRESVSKIITDLRESGLIESGYRHLTLLDLDGLRALLARPVGLEAGANAPGVRLVTGEV